MTAMFSEKAKTILEYLRKTEGQNPTLETAAQALGMSEKSLNGSLISLQREISGHGKLVYREAVEGIEKKVIFLTDEGRTIDLDSEKPEPAPKAAE